MKFLVLFLFTFNLSAQELSIDELVTQMREKNYTTLASAHNTYQAKEGISASRSALMPNLNVWQIHALVTPWGWLGEIKDIAPFLVPANWFRAQQNRKLFKVQEAAYHAVWANQILIAKTLYYQILQDQAFLEILERNVESMQSAYQIARSQEVLGSSNQGLSTLLELKVLSLEEDIRNLESYLFNSKRELAYLAGIEADEDFDLVNIALPDIENLHPINFENFKEYVLRLSPELTQFDALIEVVPSIKKEIRFSFLGTSSIQRGLAGGIFDDVPMPSGLGFGRGASLAILRSKEELLRLQRNGAKENLLRQLRISVEQYNNDLAAYHEQKRRVIVAQNLQQQLLNRNILGLPLDVLEFTEASKELLAAQSSLLNLYARFRNNQERLTRMQMLEDYISPPDFNQVMSDAR